MPKKSAPYTNYSTKKRQERGVTKGPHGGWEGKTARPLITKEDRGR